LACGVHPAGGGTVNLKGRGINGAVPVPGGTQRIWLQFPAAAVLSGAEGGENLTIARGKVRGANGRLQWALGVLGLAGEAARPAGELSHSHQQWLEICLALATEPELLLLDEPTAGMTPEETALTADFVIKLSGQGVTILVVEHDMAFVRHIARGVTVLHYGRVFADGTLEEIEANHEVRRIYLGEQ